MKYGIFLRKYDSGLYTIDYCTKSVGMTLFATYNEQQAKTKLAEIKAMTKKHNYLLSCGDKKGNKNMN